jgi:hypothetical protein
VENLVVQSDLANLNENYKNNFRVYILGHMGYLGSNIAAYLTAQGLNVLSIDTRVSDLELFPIMKGDWVLDCSRLNSFSEFSIEENASNHHEVLDWVRTSEAKYLRIGSILELQNEGQDSPYVLWSRERTKEVTAANMTGAISTLIVPNIYGGVGSNSIIDLLLRKYKSNLFFELEKPFEFRDFLHIEHLFASIKDLMNKSDTSMKNIYVTTSGICYQVGSIQDYIYSGKSSELVSKEIDYPPYVSYSVYSDELANYIKNY